METKTNTQSDTEVTIEVSLSVDEVQKERDAALKQLGKDVSLKGFRKGHVPKHILSGHIGKTPLWQEMAQRAIGSALPSIIKKHNMRVIGRPHVTITKLAPDNELEFKLTASILPDITLPDYKSIALGHNKKETLTLDVTEEEVTKMIDEIRSRVATTEKEAGKTDGQLPELTDEFVKKLGPYGGVEDFKVKLHEQIKVQKERATKEKQRLEVIEEIIKEANPKVPNILIEAELDKMLAQLRADIQRIGITSEDYFKKINKTEADLRMSWRDDAKKRAQIQLILNEIAKQENIRADEKEVLAQTKVLLAEYPPTHGDLKDAEMATQIYVATQLTNERVFEFLENQKTQ